MASHYISVLSSENIGASLAGPYLYDSDNTAQMRSVNYYNSVGVFGSKPYDNNDSQKAIDGYAFARTSKNFVFQKSTDGFPQVVSLYSGSIYPEYTQSIHKNEGASTVKTATAMRDGNYNFVTGEFAPGYPHVSTDSFGDDNAARSSYNVPGSITYMTNSNQTLSKNYDPKG